MKNTTTREITILGTKHLNLCNMGFNDIQKIVNTNLIETLGDGTYAKNYAKDIAVTINPTYIGNEAVIKYTITANDRMFVKESYVAIDYIIEGSWILTDLSFDLLVTDITCACIEAIDLLIQYDARLDYESNFTNVEDFDYAT